MRRQILSTVTLMAILAATGLLGATAAGAATCANTVTADVVAIDQPFYLNRLGAFNADGMMYVLKRDTVTRDTWEPCVDPVTGATNDNCAKLVASAPDPGTGTQLSGEGTGSVRNAMLRPDKRPRPIVLRVNEGDCLKVTFTNWLAPQVAVNHLPPDTFNLGPVIAPTPLVQRDDQPVTRMASIHVNGMQLVDSANGGEGILGDGSWVGRNASSLVAPGGNTTYTWYAESENVHHLYSMGSVTGAEGGGGTMAFGLFGALVVEPAGSVWYRSQATHEEMTLSRTGTHSGGQPWIDYEARYPQDCEGGADAPAGGGDGIFCKEGKAGLPILRILDGNEIVHTDIHAIIAGPANDNYVIGSRLGRSTPSNPEQHRPFREIASVWNDEQVALQAFNHFYTDPVLGHTMAGGRDTFMINYAANGIGSEVIANRLGVGVMWDCVDCKAEEFFLTSWAVGDPGMLVDVPAIFADPTLGGPGGPIASTALYPEDPGNVHHAYLNDHVKFRNVHAGPFEHHIFHLHAHQWVFAPYSDKANYQDMQQVGPGSGYTFDITNGGSGNRHKTPGDAIYHCHFYPHFAQGMWALYRNHEVYEEGTVLEGEVNRRVWSLREGLPVVGARALVDGEVDVQPASAADLICVNPIDNSFASFPTGAGGTCPIPGTVKQANQDLIVKTFCAAGMCQGTPIPWTVPLPGYALAPMPGGDPHVNPADPRRWVINLSETDVSEGRTPGFPFYIPGVAGHRPPTPPMDLIADGGLPRHVITSSQRDPGSSDWVVTRLDLNKELLKVTAEQLPEDGTKAEVATMNFHKATKKEVGYGGLYAGLTLPGHLTETPSGQQALFEVNGLPPQHGAPFADPCRDNAGDAISTGTYPRWFKNTGLAGAANNDYWKLGWVTPTYDAAKPRQYSIAVFQIDTVLNKVGWHHPQQRIYTVFSDVDPTYRGERPPQPMVFRLNTLDCAQIWHANLVPNFFELDDYEVRFSTDVIGQHVHMPKFDVTSADGAANGWNYEDGTLSPGEVIERIHAINAAHDAGAGGFVACTDASCSPVTKENGHIVPTKTDLLSNITEVDTTGARITVQRWMADPVLDNLGNDRGFNNSFTHDHFGPSTFQQLGTYATVLSEPAGSTWVHNETGVALGTRQPSGGVVTASTDGGPTSWQAVIEPHAGDPYEKPYREFFFEFSDFQSAYDRGWDGRIDADSFLYAKNVSVRVDANTGDPDLDEHRILHFPGVCPGGVPRPCPEVISLSDPGTFVVNYRNEPVGLRVYDPNRDNPKDPGTKGFQAEGRAGDLAFAFSSRNAVAIPELNNKMATCVRATPQYPGVIRPPGEGIGGADDLVFTNDIPTGVSYPLGPEVPCPDLTADVGDRDPATPLPRAYIGDRVKIRAQVGATEESHFFTVHGVKWLFNYDDPRSGWRNTQSMGISEQFQFDFPLFSDMPGGQGAPDSADYLYASDISNAGIWNGTWGIMRAYNRKHENLVELSNNRLNGEAPVIANESDYKANNQCPKDSRDVTFNVSAVAAREVLPIDPVVGIRTLVYNSRETTVPDMAIAGGVLAGGQGPLHDPTALLYVMTDAVVRGPVCPEDRTLLPGTTLCTNGIDNVAATIRPVGLAANTPVEPLILRANAGDCITVYLTNELPAEYAGKDPLPQPDIAGGTNYPPVIDRLVTVDPNANDPLLANPALNQKYTFNANDTAPSSYVGLHPQLVAYDIRYGDGTVVGNNPAQLAAPGQFVKYNWYAGDLRAENLNTLTPVRRNRGGEPQFRLQYTPIEFGVTGLIPADKMEQSGKGMVGALVINPANTICTEDPGTRAQADCTEYSSIGVDKRGNLKLGSVVKKWRDLVAVTQTAVNLQYNTQHLATPDPANLEAFRAVQNFKAEGGGLPADDEDSGHRAINYGSEPLWFRIAQFPPHLGLEAQAKFQNANVLSNVAVAQGNPALAGCATNVDDPACDPQSAVFTAKANTPVRMHWTEPGGGSRRAHGIKVHGHLWEREPYVVGAPSGAFPNGVPSRKLGHNPASLKVGIQIGYGTQNHFDFLFPAGGAFGVPGDYYAGMQDPTAMYTGMWGILRVLP